MKLQLLKLQLLKLQLPVKGELEHKLGLLGLSPSLPRSLSLSFSRFKPVLSWQLLMLGSIHGSFRTIGGAWGRTQLENFATGSPCDSTAMSQPPESSQHMGKFSSAAGGIHPKADVPGCQQIQAEVGKANIFRQILTA